MPIEHSTINETSILYHSLKGLGNIVVEGLEDFKSQGQRASGQSSIFWT